MTSTVLPDASRRDHLSGFNKLGSLPPAQTSKLSSIASNPWNKSIWGTNALSFAPSSTHLQVDTSTATKFQKTGSGLLVDSSTTDDWSGVSKNFDSAEVTRPASQFNRYADGLPTTQKSSHNAAVPKPSADFPSRALALTLNAGESTARPPFTSNFSNATSMRPIEQVPRVYTQTSRPGSSAEYSQLSDSDLGSWVDIHYSQSPIDDRNLNLPSNVTGHSVPSSHPSSLPASRHSEDIPFDSPQPNGLSPDSARLHSSRHSNLPPDQQLSMHLGQMSINTPADASYRTQLSRSPNSFAGGQIQGEGLFTRQRTLPDHGMMQIPTDQYYDQDMLSAQMQGYVPFGSNFYPGSMNHQGLSQYAGADHLYDGRPTSSSSSLGRRDSAHSHETQLYCGPRSGGSDASGQGRPGQPQTFRTLGPDPRAASYYSPLAMSRFQCNAMFAMPQGSYSAALATCSQMPPTTMMSPGFPPDLQGLYDPMQNYRSPLLQDFKNNGRTSKRLELKDTYGHVVEFSGDQYGSRFIQLKLETADSDEKERIFQEIEPNTIQLMTDVFGNYVIQKLFELGDQNQKRLLANKMKGQVLSLSTQMYGCRVVQKALEHVLNDQQAALIHELDQNILRCVKDQNGNHVIQKAIERCQPKTVSFILAAFTSQVMHLANHMYGCRVIQRCLEYCGPQEKAFIMDELREGMASLVNDQYSNYVMQHVVEHGTEEDRKCVLRLVEAGLGNYSKHKFASNVVEKCLSFAGDAWRYAIIEKLINSTRGPGDSMLLDLIKDNYGNYVIQRLLEVMSYQNYIMFLEHLQPELTKAKRAGQLKQVQSIEKKMTRFNQLPRSTHSHSNVSSRIPSTSTTPPPMTSSTRSVQTSSQCSVNSDVYEGASRYSSTQNFGAAHDRRKGLMT